LEGLHFLIVNISFEIFTIKKFEKSKNFIRSIFLEKIIYHIRNSSQQVELFQIVSFSIQGKLELILQIQRKEAILVYGVDFVKQFRYLFDQNHQRSDYLSMVDQLEQFVQPEQLTLGQVGYPKQC
jgi:hypothetical protein